MQFISKVHQVRRDGSTYETVFRLFDQNGTVIELTPAELWEVINLGWIELGRPNWSPERLKEEA